MTVRSRRGYTLLELTLVVVLVASFAAASVVLGRNLTRSVQSVRVSALLDTVANTEVAHAGRTGGYSADPTAFGYLDGVTLRENTSTQPGEVGIRLRSDGSLVLVARDEEGVCHVRIMDDILAGATRADSTTTAACDARSIP